MRALNEAIDGAAAFGDMLAKIKAGADDANTEAQGFRARFIAHDEAQRFYAVSDRLPGENRAAHRARLKAERRAAKAGKATA